MKFSNNFTQACYSVLVNKDRLLHLHNAEIAALINLYNGINLSESYVNVVVAFCRDLTNGCFDGMAEDIQQLVIDLEDNDMELRALTNAQIQKQLKTNNWNFMKAMAFIELENAGAFDGGGWYNHE